MSLNLIQKSHLWELFGTMNLAERLLENSHDVIVLDSLSICIMET